MKSQDQTNRQDTSGIILRVALAVLLGPVCVLSGFIGEVVGGVIGFGVVGALFLICQYLLSLGRRVRQSWPIMLGLNFLPFCISVMVMIVERKSGAWVQGVVITALGLSCSLAGAYLASLSLGKRLGQRGQGTF